MLSRVRPRASLVHPLIWIATCGPAALAQQLPALPPAAEGNALAFATDNARWSLDLAERVVWSDRRDAFTNVAALGFDYHKVWSSGDRDIGTFVLQGYLTRFDNAQMRPPFVEGPHDWEFVWRIFTFNANLLGDESLNLKVGHIELPYGLEYLYDTNGTVFDFDHGRNLGVKADWGVDVNGVLQCGEYEFAATRGTGNEWSDRGDPFAFSGRVGTPRHQDVVVGLSGFHGEVGVGTTTRRSKVAIDVSCGIEQWNVLAECAAGRVADRDVVDSRLQIECHDADGTLFGYAVSRARWSEMGAGRDSAVQLGIGFQFRPDQSWEMAMEVTQDLSVFGTSGRDTTVAAQLRHRF